MFDPIDVAVATGSRDSRGSRCSCSSGNNRQQRQQGQQMQPFRLRSDQCSRAAGSNVSHPFSRNN